MFHQASRVENAMASSFARIWQSSETLSPKPQISNLKPYLDGIHIPSTVLYETLVANHSSNLCQDNAHEKHRRNLPFLHQNNCTHQTFRSHHLAQGTTGHNHDASSKLRCERLNQWPLAIHACTWFSGGALEQVRRVGCRWNIKSKGHAT